MMTKYPREVLETVAARRQIDMVQLLQMLASGAVPLDVMVDIDSLMRGDATAFPASANVPGQAESRTAYKSWQATLDACPFAEEYLQLRSEGWSWRQAVYIAWCSIPTGRRQPKTKKELAEKLGLRSDRTFRAWCKKRPEILKRIEEFTVSTLGGHLADVIDAWVTVAKTPDPAAHKDRITYLETMKVYKKVRNLELTGEDGEPIRIDLDAEYEKDMARLAEMVNSGQAPDGEEDEDE